MKCCSIYGSFQNSEDSDLSGEASFLINENIIKTLDFDVASGKIIKLESPWKTEAGDFEIKIVINSLFQNGIEIEPHNLIESGTSTKIKITRKIDFEYISEVSAETFNNTVKAIDEIAESTSKKLEKAKTKDVLGSTSIGGNGEATTDSVGEVAGTQFSREESEGSLSVAGSTSDGFFGTVKNIFIVILQSILKYWKLAFVILLALLMLWFIKKKD